MKRIALEYPSNALRYNKILSKNEVNTQVDKDIRKDQLLEGRQNLAKEILVPLKYQKGCWIWCHNEYVLMNCSLKLDPYGQIIAI